jgi:transposase
MVPVPLGVRVWLAVGHTDMRRGRNSLAIQVQQVLGRDPHAGDLYVFRGKRGHLIKIPWHDGIGMSLYAKRLERGRFYRQSETYAREGVDLDVSTLADHVGACTAALKPLRELIRQHVFDADREHGDDTTLPVLAKGKTITGRLWTPAFARGRLYVRDDRPFAGPDPPAVFFYSRNRGGEHPARHLAGYAGILQADA